MVWVWCGLVVLYFVFGWWVGFGVVLLVWVGLLVFVCDWFCWFWVLLFYELGWMFLGFGLGFWCGSWVFVI